jgi:2-polyprenyl-3-methyl-5-hydroxy-6-metoxy-1,4-benzoquinol methylase
MIESMDKSSNIANEKDGIHSLLRFNFIYDLVQNLLGSNRGREVFIRDYVKPLNGQKILDFGCGTGTLFKELKHLKDITYYGIEPNAQYVNACRKIYSSFQNAHFINGSVDKLDHISEKFDSIVVSAVLHHLKTEYWPDLIKSLYLKLNEGGKIILLDIVFHPSQHIVSKILISLDRGESVLNIDDYLKVIKGNYVVKSDLRTDLMRIPYSHLITIVT